jgi:hypothetical protein
MTVTHTHSYVRWKRQGKDNEWWYKCADPHCTYIAPRSLVIGKSSLCPECHEHEFILDHEALRRAVPKCHHCRNTKEAKARRAGEELIKEIGVEDGEVNESII